MRIETQRLSIEPAGRGDVDELLAVFNSNADYLESSEGRRAYDRDDVELYLETETARENGRCLAIRHRDDGRLAGTATLLVPHSAGCPWIGLLIVHGDAQGQGIGREAVLAIEDALAGERWAEVRLGVLESTEGALAFWTSLGYAEIERASDAAGRPCTVLSKRI
jgi:GNAT superfamily N-acetyltransferase